MNHLTNDRTCFRHPINTTQFDERVFWTTVSRSQVGILNKQPGEIRFAWNQDWVLLLNRQIRIVQPSLARKNTVVVETKTEGVVQLFGSVVEGALYRHNQRSFCLLNIVDRKKFVSH